MVTPGTGKSIIGYHRDLTSDHPWSWSECSAFVGDTTACCARLNTFFPSVCVPVPDRFHVQFKPQESLNIDQSLWAVELGVVWNWHRCSKSLGPSDSTRLDPHAKGLQLKISALKEYPAIDSLVILVILVILVLLVLVQAKIRKGGRKLLHLHLFLIHLSIHGNRMKRPQTVDFFEAASNTNHPHSSTTAQLQLCARAMPMWSRSFDTHTNRQIMWNPPSCRRVWLEGVVLVSVLGLNWFLRSLARVFASSVSSPPPRY